MNVFEAVKTSINTREAATRYGVEVNRHGKALCPFHNDRHPSLFVDDDHYHCYACGEHGDVIDFTAKLFGLKLYEAAQKLAYDFGITQDKPPTKAMQEKQNRKSEAQRLRENEKLCFSALLEYMKLLQEWKRLYAPRTPEDKPHDRFVQKAVCQGDRGQQEEADGVAGQVLGTHGNEISRSGAWRKRQRDRA